MIECAVEIGVRGIHSRVIRAEYHSDETWKIKPLQRPKKFDRETWELLRKQAIHELHSKVAYVQNRKMECYPMRREKAEAVQVMHEIEEGKIVKKMSEGILFILE